MIAMKDQVVKRIVLYVIITFVLTWAYWFLVSYPLAQSTSEGIASSQMLQLSIAPAMLFPALGVVLTRLITREEFKNVHIAPVVFKKTWKYWLLGWLGPAVLIMVGAALYFLVNPQDFSIEQGILAKQLEGASGSVLSSDILQMIIVVQLLVGTFLAPLLNILTAFGEEWGWRGYLLPHMLQHFKVLPALLICGVIWGLWHAPVTILGHNYGLGYWGYPVTGILAMCVFCTVMGVFLSYLTLRTGSCIPAALAHGGINGMVSAGMLFSVTGGNSFIGPMPTGILAGIPFIVLAVVLAAKLVKQERNGEELMVTKL